MLIYNHNKEFIGISEEGLRILGCANINELLNECYDFADLFVKRPGYIHNFKNFNWIDFIEHAEADEAKAIVHIKGKTFSCYIEIRSFALVADPANPAFEILLTGIKALGADENAKIAQEVSSSPRPEVRVSTPSVAAVATETFDNTIPTMDAIDDVAPPALEVDTYEEVSSIEPLADTMDDSDAEFDPYDVPASNEETYTEPSFDPASLVPDFDKPLEIEDDIFMDTEDETPVHTFNDEGKLDISFDDDEEDNLLVEVAEEAPMLGDYISNKDAEYIDNLKTDKDYKYDPHVAADELGLPVDLIEEFIEDFIQQAHEFNDELYESTAKEDFDNVKVLSHKLKGVAANLRIEDAFEVLSIVNTSNDREEIEANLKQLNRIIAKLEGKDPDEVMSIGSAPVAEPTPIEEPISITDESTQEDESPALVEDEPSFEDDLELPPMPDLEETPSNEDINEDEDDLYNLNAKEDEESDDDLYDFAPIESLTDHETMEQAPVSTEDDEDDLYALDPLGDEEDSLLPSIEESTESTTDDDDLYAMEPLDIKEEIPLEEISEPAIEEDDDDLYSMEPLSTVEETPVSEEESSEEESDDDLYPLEPLAEAEPEDEENIEASPEVSLHFDPSKAANELGIDANIINELLADFVEQSKSMKIDLESAVESEDFTSLKNSAIILKGVSDNLRISEVSEELLNLSNSNDVSNAQESLSKLYTYIDQL